MKGDTSPMRVLLVVDSSTGYLGATAVKWMTEWLETTSYARMKVQSDAEQSVEHLLKAVKSTCTADLIVQRAPAKSHASQGHGERAVRLVENRYRALLFDVQERTRVQIDPISAAPAWILRHSVWLLNRYQPHKRRATSFERLTGCPTDLRFSRCSRWLGVWCHRIENLKEFSWLRKEYHEHSDQCGLVAQKRVTNILL